jgi:cytochrome c oxidase subunit 4
MTPRTQTQEPQSQLHVVAVGAALLGLWGLSLGLSYVGLGAASVPVALGIAVAKAALVILFFMELAHERASIKLTLLTAMGLGAILLGLMVVDVQTR